MNILIDIDDTLCVTSPTWTRQTELYMLSRNVPRIRPQEQDTYALEDSYALTPEQKEEYLKYMYDHMPWDRLPPVLGAASAVAKLQELGHTVEFITSRQGSVYGQTYNWLVKQLNVKSPKLHFSEYGENLSPDLLIDNSELRCQSFAQRNIKVLLFAGSLVAVGEGGVSGSFQKVNGWITAINYIKKIKESR